jgi:hypothetical protein
VDLSGASFADGITFAFPEGTVLGAGDRVVIASDAPAFAARYPGVPLLGGYEQSLSNGGERLRLETPGGDTLADVDYGADGLWPVAPDGFGWSLVPRDPARNDGHPERWRASATAGGSPGAPDPEDGRPLVVISEVLANASDPYEDAIELRNESPVAADISGWFLSDDRGTLDELRKFAIPPGTLLAPGATAVFYAADFDAGGPTAFGLAARGEEVYLTAVGAGGAPTGYIAGFEFPAVEDNLSIGRVATSAGADIAVLEHPTFGADDPPTVDAFREGKGAPNAAPRLAAAFISEVMYHPVDGEPEWIEIENRLDTPLALGAPGPDEHGWQLGGDTAYGFPDGTVLPPRGRILVLGAGDPDLFRAAAGVPADVAILSAFDPDLGNHRATIRLLAPVADLSSPGDPAYTWADGLSYLDRRPWPPAADGEGPSLERLAGEHYGNDPRSWHALTPGGSPGRPNGVPHAVFLPVGMNRS